MPFNQQMTAPVELRLGADWNPPAKPAALHLTALPVYQIESLRGGKGTAITQTVKEAATLADKLDAFDAELTLELGGAKGFTLDLRGTKLAYDATKQTLTCKGVAAPLAPTVNPQKANGGEIQLRVLVDRGSVEVFANRGRVAMSVAAIPDEKKQTLELIPNGGTLVVRGGVWRMKSAWGK
jgi:sucrose-6-phosphate hydrolase SacC (GH32 family)